MQLLEQLCHEHGVLAARDADRNPVAVADQTVVLDRPHKSAEQNGFEAGADALLHPFAHVSRLLLCNLAAKPRGITARKTVGAATRFAKPVGNVNAENPSRANHNNRSFRLPGRACKQSLRVCRHSPGNAPVGSLIFAPHIVNHIPVSGLLQFFRRDFHSESSRPFPFFALL